MMQWFGLAAAEYGDDADIFFEDLNELLATSEMFEDWNSIKQNIMQQNFKSCFWELLMKHIIYKIYFFSLGWNCVSDLEIDQWI